jgi:hypothetical protein
MANPSLLDDIIEWIGDGKEQIGYLANWVTALIAIKDEINRLRWSHFGNAAGVFVCPDTGSGSATENVVSCLQQKITLAGNCLTNCASNEGICEQLADDLDLYFKEPSDTDPNSDYYNQSTGCTVLGAAEQKKYVFLWELENWIKKLKHRRDYLQNQNLMMVESVALIENAIDKIGDFLSSTEVQDLRALFTYLNGPSEANIDPVIYAWKDDDKLGPPLVKGKWHAVLVDANVPTRCNIDSEGRGACRRLSCQGDSHDDSCEEPNMPEIKSYTMVTNDYYSLVDYNGKGDCGTSSGGYDVCPFASPWQCWSWGWGFPLYRDMNCCKDQTYKKYKKCFKGGMVKARAIRYDEETTGNPLSFATGHFWDFRSRNPNSSPWTGDVNDQIAGNNGACRQIMEENGGTLDEGGSFGMAGAFMLNHKTPENTDCYNLMKDLLKRGIESRSCAEYFYRDNNSNDNKSESAFGFKFVPCRANAW